MSDESVDLFRIAVREINDVYAKWIAEEKPGGQPTWPAHLRIKGVKKASAGVLEMTWSFKNPDGRATFEFIEIDGEMAIRWRRIGGHVIYGAP